MKPGGHSQLPSTVRIFPPLQVHSPLSKTCGGKHVHKSPYLVNPGLHSHTPFTSDEYCGQSQLPPFGIYPASHDSQKPAGQEAQFGIL